MKKLMLGNIAFARGLYEAGCGFISSYPGTPSTEITEGAAKYEEIYAEWAPNEKVALESAFGASLAGKRSFCGMKQVGLNVAADPLFTISYTGVNAGMIIGVADDPGMHSSQNEQDSRHYAASAKLPMLEPSDSTEAKEFVKVAYELSETFDTAVMVKMCTRVSHSQSIVETAERVEAPKRAFEKNPEKYVMTPANATTRHPIIEKRQKDIATWAETANINRIEDGEDKSMGIITSSTSYQYVKEVCGDKYPVLKLGMINPLPEKKIKDFAASVEKLVVVEELDPFIETHCRFIGLEVVGKEIFSNLGEFSQNRVAKSLGMDVKKSVPFDEDIPNRPPSLCSGCPHRSIFYILHKLGLNVIGDIGCYTLGSAAPLNAMDMNICMGASISGLHGFVKAVPENGKKSVAVIGESTFMHSGMTGLVNIAYNGSNSTVLILDNSTTGMTGHQQNPTTGYNLKGDPTAKVNLESFCHSIGFERVRVIDPYNLEESEAVIKEELEAIEPSVVISRRPCALLKYVKHPGPIECNTSKCIGCRKCMRLGCPSISMSGGKTVIDNTLCVGCGVCAELCPTGALPGRGEM